MLDGRSFKTRLTIAIAATYFGPPILGLSFLVGVVQTLTFHDVQRLMSGSVLPFYIVGSGLGAVAFFRWFLRPIVDFANGECDAQVATKRMRSFLWVFWLLFVARHLLGSLLLMLAIETVFPVAPAGNELRMFSLAWCWQHLWDCRHLSASLTILRAPSRTRRCKNLCCEFDRASS